jgi:hypothetical protein
MILSLEVFVIRMTSLTERETGTEKETVIENGTETVIENGIETGTETVNGTAIVNGIEIETGEETTGTKTEVKISTLLKFTG